MQHDIVVSGFGGQGVLFAGQVLAHAALEEGRQVTWIPSYGPEMRGGTANCTVIISDDEIGSPLVRHPSDALVLNPPSMVRFAPLVRAGGTLVLDATLVAERSGRSDIDEIALPARAMAAELGYPQAANVIMLGALAAATGIVALDTLARVLATKALRHPEMLDANARALTLGAAFVSALQTRA